MLNHDFEFLQMLTRNDLTEYLPDRTGKTQEFRGHCGCRYTANVNVGGGVG